MAVIRQGSRVTFWRALKRLRMALARSAGARSWGDESVAGDGVGCQAVALDGVEDADSCALVALVGECLQALGLRLGRARGGRVVGRR